MRQGELVGIRNGELVIEDVEIARARPVGDPAHAAQTVLDGVQVAQKLLRRDAGAQQHHSVHEDVLVEIVGGLAFIEARYVDDLGIGQRAQLGDGLVEHGDLAFALLARLGHERHVAAQAQKTRMAACP